MNSEGLLAGDPKKEVLPCFVPRQEVGTKKYFGPLRCVFAAKIDDKLFNLNLSDQS